MDIILSLKKNIEIQDDIIQQANKQRSFYVARYLKLIEQLYPISSLMGNLSVYFSGYNFKSWPVELTSLTPLTEQSVSPLILSRLKPFSLLDGFEVDDYFSAEHIVPPVELNFFPKDKHYVVYSSNTDDTPFYDQPDEIIESLIVMID